MAPQSEPRDGFNNAQEKVPSSSKEESTLRSCSGHETPGQKEGIHTEQAEAPCMGSQACTPQKAEPACSVPVQSLHLTEGRPFGCDECALGTNVDPAAAEPSTCTPHASDCGTGSEPAAPQRTASSERSFFCPDCGRGFAHGQHLARHRRVHTGERPFACAQCGRRFGSRPNLVAHSRAHSGARPFACAQCGRRFSRKSHLGRHQAVHTGSRPHACAVCARCFSSKTNLVRHQAIHTGSRPFSCPQCAKSFSRKTHLVRHQRIHGEAALPAPASNLSAPAWSNPSEVVPPPIFF